MEESFAILTGTNRRSLYCHNSKLSRWVSKKISEGYDFLLLEDLVSFGDTYSYLQKKFPVHILEIKVFGRHLEQPTPFVLTGTNNIRYCYAFKASSVEPVSLPEFN